VASGGEGVAYRLYRYIDRFLYERRLGQKWLIAASDVSAMTINRLRTQENPPKAETIHALAEALAAVLIQEGKLEPTQVDQFRDELAVMAGRLQPATDDPIPVREAIERSSVYTREQKTALLAMVDALDAANRDRAPAGWSDDPNRSDSVTKAM